MAANSVPPNFQLFTSDTNKSVGVGLETPDPQNVRLDMPVTTFTAVNQGGFIHLSLGGYPYVSLSSLNVMAFKNQHVQSWHFTRRAENAYTIEAQPEKKFAWTVSGDWPNADIVIAELNPDFKCQLFRIDPVD